MKITKRILNLVDLTEKNSIMEQLYGQFRFSLLSVQQELKYTLSFIE